MSTNTSIPAINLAPWLSVSNAKEAIDYFKAAFDATELYLLEDDNGNPHIAQLSFGGADFWIQDDPDSTPELVSRGSVRMIVTVKDPDSVFRQAIAAGATEVVPIGEEHGWRIGRVVDPFGYHWEIGKRLSG
ncbi:VOC family protein [Lederbergia citrea]|uniref:VOC family protein n=1 Tax=Lederbergia citrea TaxID=2833581 RepID=A0A942UT13_9BACI|nr:VOC family protein [Lederbergia citrea]MBS4176368.1 VOC family protein [Lederbergia citrea]MBS4202929.1 VOC family protein [Lederbergia citrea]MBS4222399.1 VOC family protein [Lederbergia citrea]